MPPSITSEKITLTYPIFCAVFVDEARLLVGGGGGEGRSGVGNKITLLDVSEPPTVKKSPTDVSIKVLAEIELSKQEDAVMSLAVVPKNSSLSPSEEKSHQSKKRKTVPPNDPSTNTSETHETTLDECEERSWLALAGINSSESAQQAGKNDHFRVFRVSAETPDSASISLASQHEFFSSTVDVGSYQRLIRTNGSVAAIGSGAGLVSKAASEVVILDTPSLDIKRRIRLPGKEECADLDLSAGGLVVYCTAKEIFVTSTIGKDGGEPPRKITWQSSTSMKGSLRSVRFCGPECIVAVLNHPARTGSELLLIDITGSGKCLARKNLHKNVKAATAMDAISLGPHQTIVSIAGADQSVEVLVVENYKIATVKTFREVHPFQITKVAFSPVPVAHEHIQLASTSIANTVVVFTLPLVSGHNGHRSLLRGSSIVKQTFLSVFLSLIGVVIFAVVLQLMFEARAGLPLPMERNAILSRFNEVLGAKTAETAMPEVEEPFMVLKEVENGDDNLVDIVDDVSGAYCSRGSLGEPYY
ncbi:hypothetical protein P167DRAFT_576508 [Morchella conica CCBAS932]|uniref:Guanine nucleotide-exchange factor SEC12 n=1 Tax=Morchella conica CCBAS932 TaxID=1392247 RepID=A0A3N4KP19_9PEZI|nr:hypothetical protein P167DRAFT_576508 [Morchella conica CCBAS932]